MGLGDTQGWTKPRNLLVAFLGNSGKNKHLCFPSGEGKANSCDAQVLDGLSIQVGLERAGSLGW